MKTTKNLFLLLCVLIFMSCDRDTVYFEEPLPNWGGEVIRELPHSLAGTYYPTGNTQKKTDNKLNKVSISFPGHNTRIHIEADGSEFTIYYNPKSQILQSEVNFAFHGDNGLDNKKVKMIEYQGSYYLNIPQYVDGLDYWNCFIITPKYSNRLTITTSGFYPDHFRSNRAYYKSNRNFRSFYDDENEKEGSEFSNDKLFFHAHDKDDLENILEDDFLIKTYELIRR